MDASIRCGLWHLLCCEYVNTEEEEKDCEDWRRGRRLSTCLPALPFRAECLLLLPVSADGNADMVSLDFNCKVKALPGSPLNQYIFDMMVLIKSHEKQVIRKIETLAPAEHLSCSVWEHLLLQAESKKCLYQCRLTKCRDLHASVYFNFAEEMCQLLKKTLKDVENRRLYHN